MIQAYLNIDLHRNMLGFMIQFVVYLLLGVISKCYYSDMLSDNQGSNND